MSGSETSREFFYCEFCPALNDCSRGSWKNGAVWGWSEEECRFQLNKHLQNGGNAGKHQTMSASDRKLLVAGADLVCDVHHFPKRGRHAEDGQASSSEGHPAPIGARQADYQIEAGGEMCDALQLAQMAADQEDHVGHVVLRQVEFDSIIDSVARASSCARSAQRLAASAAKAFSDEVASLDAVKGHLQKIRENAEIEMRL
jgi:hypothetical protein